jgi:transcriptional regulator with XRE-family HTH domain
MRDLDKAAMGKRIRQIRLAAGLRQWELARMLGTTQSAVHKYEHGVVPEPRRLVELARVGGTSVEWVLTGHHWENGSETQERISPDVLNTADILSEIGEDRARVDEALKIVREAVRALKAREEPDDPPDALSALLAHLGDQSEETLRLLESAARIQRAVLRRVAREAEKRLEAG